MSEVQTAGLGRFWHELSGQQRLVFVVASLSWFFDCLDSQFFNLARDAALDDLLGDKSRATLVGPYSTSLFLLGWAVGGLTLGALGDRHGRARVLSLCVLSYSLCTGLGAFSTGLWDFCFYRFLTGCGVGGVFGLAVALVADSLPPSSRSPALGLLQSLSTWGNILAGLVGMALGSLSARVGLPWGLRPWQCLFLIGAVPAGLSVMLLRRVPEPERWRSARVAAQRRGDSAGSYRELLRQTPWARHAWAGLVVCGAGVIGYWGIGNFHPRIVGSLVAEALTSQGLSPSELAAEQAYWRSLALLLQNVGGFFGMLVFAVIAERRGRKPAVAGALCLSFVVTAAVFGTLRTFSQIYWMLPLMGFGQMAVYSVYAIYLPELFPTSLRSTGTSFCYNGGRIAAASAPFTISRLTASLGGDVEAFRAAGMWVSGLLLLGLLGLPFLPESRGQSLPE